MTGRMALSLTTDPSLDVDPGLGFLLQRQNIGQDGQSVLAAPLQASGEPIASDTVTPRPSAAWGPTRFDAVAEEMREFLSILLPSTDAEALQSLRLAFPTVPLADRIAAIQTRFFS